MLGVSAALIAATTTINVFSWLHDQPALAAWEPAVWEYSSGLSVLLCLVVPWLAVRVAPPGKAPWPRVLAVHLPASLLFSAAHVGLFVLFRHLAYAALGERYDFGPTVPEFLYEYRKDLLAYVGSAALFSFAPEWLARRAAPPEPARPAEPPLFEIRDGSRRLRVPLSAIAAATSAGNYVEVILTDGRRPLTRATLASVEAELAPHGFVRVHRSWLVNTARVRGLAPERSGDHRIELEGGLTAPLSRRFPQALERLRAG